MTLRRAQVVCEVKELHEIGVYTQIVCYLKSRFRVMYAGRFEERPVAHDRSLIVNHAQR